MPGPARAPYTYDEVDSEALPAAELVALWRETRGLPIAVEPVGDDDGRQRFRVRVRRLTGPSGHFADLTATPIKFNREKSHYARDGLDMVSLTLIVGHDVQHQFGTAGQSVIVGPGQILVRDFTQPAIAFWRRSSRSLNLCLPRLTVEAAVGEKVKHLHGTVLSRAGLSPMLETQLLALGNIAPRLKGSMRAAALDATVELAVSVLRCELGARLEDDANNAGLFAAAQVFIQRHLASHRLNAELIAQQLGCSRAHLYRVFASRDETVAHYLRELRLRRARDLLAGHTEVKTRIGDVAYRCGFDDPVHFTRYSANASVSPQARSRPTDTSPNIEMAPRALGTFGISGVALFSVVDPRGHIAPWRSTYAATEIYRGPVKFVLSASGHIAGVVNPAGRQIGPLGERQ